MRALLALLLGCYLGLATCQRLMMNRTGCGNAQFGKACLFRPVGCNPDRDCTLGIISYPIDSNHLRVELVAATLIPKVELQYIAIGFSKDDVMGDDTVTECVLGESSFSGLSAEVFVSYNTRDKLNNRVYVPEEERLSYLSDVRADVVDGRLNCHFTQQIVPEAVSQNNGLIWSLNENYFIFGATGSAQPDEINAHDMQHGSYFYPIMSPKAVNPTQNEMFKVQKAAPTKFPPSTTSTTTTTTTTSLRDTTTTRTVQHKKSRFLNDSSSVFCWFSLVLATLLLL